jgi:rhodanese-related sulfurtransferase
MRKYGFTNVSALEGGFDAWKGSGNPTQQGE